jgi:phage terminase small subunit
MNCTSEMMLAAYTANIKSNDWLQKKAKELEKYNSKYEALKELSSMDSGNLSTFAEMLDVSVEDLQAVKRVFRNI